jgi:hypothetical protein
MSVVYWIHLEEHKDILKDGYIGVSAKTASKRYLVHKNAAKNGSEYPVHRAIRKYGEALIVSILVEGPSKYCYEIEAKLRPKFNIGWNIASGGGHGGFPLSIESRSKISQARKNFSQETKDKLALIPKMKGKKHSPETVAKLIKNLNRNGCKDWPSWKHPRANHEMWKYAQEVYLQLKEKPKTGPRKLTQLFPISNKTAVTIKNKILTGWIPAEDEQWLLFKSA